MVVGVDGIAGADLAAGDLDGAVGNDLVGVHVGAGTGAGLEDIDDEVVVESAVDDFGGGGGDPVRALPVGSKLMVDSAALS